MTVANCELQVLSLIDYQFKNVGTIMDFPLWCLLKTSMKHDYAFGCFGGLVFGKFLSDKFIFDKKALPPFPSANVGCVVELKHPIYVASL